MSTTINHTTTLTTLECCQCGMALGLSKTWTDRARDLGGFRQKFWCPYCGNRQGWGESRHEKEVKRLSDEVTRANCNAEWYKRRSVEAKAEADHFRKSRDGFKGVLSKIKRRVSHGVCPCCNRTFGNIARHMQTKHPKHVAESALQSKQEGRR